MSDLPELDRMRRDLHRLAGHQVVLHGSAVSGRATPRSDIDVAVVTGQTNTRFNKETWLRLLGQAPDRYDLRVFELLPLPIQVSIAEQHLVVFGDAVELSYYFYRYRRRWKDQALRHRQNQFTSFDEKMSALQDRRMGGIP